MNLGDFFSELKRRNVYKVAVAYAVAAWLLIQAASILFPTFEAPNSHRKGSSGRKTPRLTRHYREAPAAN